MKVEAKVCNDMDHSGGVNVSVKDGNVSIDFKTLEGKDVSRKLSPDSAVRLWRFLMGEFGVEGVRVGCLSGNMHGVYNDDGAKWTISLLPDLVAELDADQAMALAWGIKKCVADVLDTTPKEDQKIDMVKRISLSDVWVLSANRILTGDSVADGVERLGGDVKVYSSADKARNDLRNFLRPLVNEAYSETWWGSSDRNVDDILDEVIDGEQIHRSESVWIHDGQNQSFQVTLSKKMIDEI